MTQTLEADPALIESGAHMLCLDMLHVAWSGDSSKKQQSECAILTEIWRSGGLIQVSHRIPRGTALLIRSGSRPVKAHVVSCEEDEFGFVVQFAEESSKGWYPNIYRPPYVLPTKPLQATSVAAK